MIFKSFYKRIAGALAQNIGIDLGTYNTSIYSPNQGIILSQPSRVMVYERNKMLEYGNTAKVTLGKESEGMKIIRPLKYGVINDPEATRFMLKNFLKQSAKSKFFGMIKPNVLVCVPSSATSAERETIAQTVYQSGATNVFIVDEAICAAIGSNSSMKESTGAMVIDFGGGTVNFGVTSIGGVVCQKSVRLGGDELNERIVEYVKTHYQINIGINTAENIKHNISNACPDNGFDKAKSSMNVIGTDIENNPVEFTITSEDVFKSIEPVLVRIASEAKRMIQSLQPELSADIFQNGITLTGGGANLKNIDKYLFNYLKIKCYIAENPDQCVARGTGKIFEAFNDYKHLITRY